MRNLKTLSVLTLLAGALVVLKLAMPVPAVAGDAATGNYKVLAPITHGSLTIFPVVSNTTHDTHEFLTLDEGLRSGEVVVTEAGQVQGLYRRRGGQVYPPSRPRYDGAQVNSLVLVNNSQRPLLLLAGEIVTGGKQDRVIGKDRIIPAESDPIDLGVFCVEPGRWVASSDKFGGLSAQMAQPSVRSKAMGAKDQQQVWDAAGKARGAVIAAAPAPSAEAIQVEGGTSYAKTMENRTVRAEVDKVAAPMQQSYESVIRQLKDQHAVGVVVAINGDIQWVDIFASTELLQKYWPKLVRSYAAETVGIRQVKGAPSLTAAQAFLDDWSGKRQTVETEPGLFRHVEVAGRGFRAFQLTSLLPKTGFDLHLSKMAEDQMIGD
jgi:hypothetical protein